MDSKLIIVSNRGPNDFVWRENHWEVRKASGGLVSMIDPLARRPDVTWFCCVSEPPTTDEARQELFTTSRPTLPSPLMGFGNSNAPSTRSFASLLSGL